jgi:hypothetical protein
MKKPPIPSFIAAVPAPKSYLIYKIIAVVLIFLIVGFIYNYYRQKKVNDES